VIGAFQKRRLPDDAALGNVTRLLRYHLTRSRELLWAEVNGGLDEECQAEIDRLFRPLLILCESI